MGRDFSLLRMYLLVLLISLLLLLRNSSCLFSALNNDMRLRRQQMFVLNIHVWMFYDIFLTQEYKIRSIIKENRSRMLSVISCYDYLKNNILEESKYVVQIAVKIWIIYVKSKTPNSKYFPQIIKLRQWLYVFSKKNKDVLLQIQKCLHLYNMCVSFKKHILCNIY